MSSQVSPLDKVLPNKRMVGREAEGNLLTGRLEGLVLGKERTEITVRLRENQMLR